LSTAATSTLSPLSALLFAEAVIATTAGHGECVVNQFASQPGVYDLLLIASDEGEYLYPESLSEAAGVAGHGTADNHLNPMLEQKTQLFFGIVLWQLEAGWCAVRFIAIDQKCLPGNIEHRGNSAVPYGESCNHPLNLQFGN